MDTNWNCGPISFLTLDPLNVDHKLLTVALDDFANLLSFVVTTYNLNKTVTNIKK